MAEQKTNEQEKQEEAIEQKGADGAHGGSGDSPADDGKKSKDPKSYTSEEVDAIVEARIARLKAEMQRKSDKEKKEAAENAVKESEKLQSMTDVEKAEHKARKLQEENDRLKQEKNLNEQMAIARRELSDADIHMPDDLLSMFVSPEAEKTKDAITAIKEMFPAAVDAAVKEKLKSSAPKDPNPGGSSKSFGQSFAEQYNQKMTGGKANGTDV